MSVKVVEIPGGLRWPSIRRPWVEVGAARPRLVRELGHGLELHVAVLELHSSCCSMRTASTRRTIAASFGKMPTTSARRFTSLFSRSSGLVECSLTRCWAREGHVGQDVMLALVHQRREFGPAGPELIGDLPPGMMGGIGVGLEEGLPQRGGDHGVLAFRHMGQGVAHPMDPAALPGGAEHAGDRLLEALVGIGDHQLHAVQATADQGLEKAGPEGLLCGWPPACKKKFARSGDDRRLRSCVRPVCAAPRPLALMGVRRLGASSASRVQGPGTFFRLPQPLGATDHAITPILPASISLSGRSRLRRERPGDRFRPWP